MKIKANTDTTYCRSFSCQSKCWRHIKNWEFDKDENYWFMEECEFKDKLDFRKEKQSL